MNDKNNKAVWWVVGAIIVLIIIVLIARAHKNSSTGDASDNGMDSSVLEAGEDVSEGSVNAPTATTPAPALSYAQALAKYKNARIQFDALCAATPGMQTWKNGTNVMLDNRSANTISLHIGVLGNVSVKPWGFKIVNFSASPLPATILVDCGTRQNVATVILQK